MGTAVKTSISIDGIVLDDRATPTEEISSPVFTVYDKYRAESFRRETFANWPLQTRIDGAKLAKAGFIYRGHQDEVQCVFCKGCIKDWKFADSAMKKHRESFPLCDFVSGRSNNIPLSGTSGHSSWNSNGETSLRELPVSNGFSEMHLNNKPVSHDVHSNNVLQNHISSELPDFEKLKSEEERRKTFEEGWPSNSVNPNDLARAGFFYLGDVDKVQCSYCQGIVSKWEPQDNPIKEHCRHFPRCPFIMNIAHSFPSEQNMWFKRNGHDVCGKYDYSQNSLPENGSYMNGLYHDKLEDLGVNIHKGPVHPEQSTEAARLRSFVSWPTSAPVRKEDLSKAGFFYIGISDHTKCFHCDVGLSRWEPNDDPWVEHARWSPKCNFLQLTKGDEFVTKCNKQDRQQQNCSLVNGTTTKASFDDTTVNSKADEIMQSSMVKAVFEAGLYPPYLVRAAVIQQIKETGGTFANLDELCEAIAAVQDEISNEENETSITVNGILNNPEELELNLSSPSQVHKDLACEMNIKRRGPPNGICTEKALDPEISEEYQALKDQRLCKICMDNEVGIVFLPCGHLLACTSCATALKDCPLCRTAIRGSVRVFMP